MGAGKWRPEYSESLQGKRVVILPDADEPGRKHGDTIAQALTGKAQEILKLTLPDGVKDLSEWASEGKSSAELLALLQSALAYHGQDDGPRAAAPVGPSPSQPDTQPQRLTDLGNGECFADQHRHRARYCYALETWFICDETSLWERDPGNLVMQLAKHSVRALYDDAQREPNDECRIKLAKHAIQSESAERLKNMIVLARSEPGMALSPDDFDPDPWLLSVANGVINLRTGQLRLREWADFITKRSPIHFDPHATCPTFQRFLDRIFQNDQSLIAYLQQVVGYCLTGLTSEQQFFLLWGSGANGKSTLLTVLLGLLGNYGLQTPAETFLRRKQDGRATPELARLAGARLAVACESDQGCRLAEGLIKQMTGNDRIAARGLWENIFEFTPTHKILLATNHKPRIDDATHAMWRRMCLIPFEVQIPDHEQDRQLAATLLTELPGILNWALIGCLEC
jgi:putative DNA primase/helicase